LNSTLRYCGHLTLVGLSTFALWADQKTLTEYSIGDSAKSRVRLYQKDKLQRTEMDDVRAVILRPDGSIYLDLEKRTFQKTPTGPPVKTEVTISSGSSNAGSETRKSGFVKTRVIIEDTEERRQMFGYEARRLKMLTEIRAGADTCHPGDMRMETDGWYIDLKDQTEAKADGGPSGRVAENGGCKDEYQAEYSGSGKSGFPLEYTSKIWQNGQGPQITAMKVLEFSEETLNPLLFEIPQGFTDVQASLPAASTISTAITTTAGAAGASAGLQLSA
jgi:hypothetical protein